MMKDFWERLTRTQRYALIGGGVVVVLLVLVQLIVLPIRDAHNRTKSALRANQRILREMVPLSGEYRRLQEDIAQLEGQMATRPGEFNLFSYVEKRTGEAEIKPYVKSINPSRTATVGPYEEMAVDVKLETVTLKQLTDFLYRVESPMELVKIKTLAVTKNKEKTGYLNAALQIVTYMRPKGEAPAGRR